MIMNLWELPHYVSLGSLSFILLVLFAEEWLIVCLLLYGHINESESENIILGCVSVYLCELMWDCITVLFVFQLNTYGVRVLSGGKRGGDCLW